MIDMQDKICTTEEGKVVINLDGQKFRITYKVNGHVIKRIFDILEKQGYRLAKRISKTFARESNRARRYKGLK